MSLLPVMAAAVLSTATNENTVQPVRADVCVIGGGSGGIGAAPAAARGGADVILIERQGRLGGTAVQAYVCNWEPGPAGPFAKEIYDRLRKRGAAAVTRDHNPGRKLGPFGLWLPDPKGRWENTLRRSSRPASRWRAVVFDPDAYSETVREMLEETGRCRLFLGTECVAAKSADGRVQWVEAVRSNGSRIRVSAKVFIDCTGNVAVCRMLGCETMLGAEPRDRFGEPSAPPAPSPADLNAISLCYRIRDAGRPTQEPPAPAGPPPQGWQRAAHIHAPGPGTDRIVNPLALIPGRLFIELGEDGARREAEKRAKAHWRRLHQFQPFRTYELHSLAPMLGVRESWRVVTRYILTEHDVRGGLSHQKHPDMIALADHSLDVHGAGSHRVHGELREPYGIPFRCLLPVGWSNLMVACRGAGFSHVAASSCRLSRTMLALGRAAGTAAALAVARGERVDRIDPLELRRVLFPDPAHPLHPGKPGTP